MRCPLIDDKLRHNIVKVAVEYLLITTVVLTSVSRNLAEKKTIIRYRFKSDNLFWCETLGR